MTWEICILENIENISSLRSLTIENMKLEVCLPFIKMNRQMNTLVFRKMVFTGKTFSIMLKTNLNIRTMDLSRYYAKEEFRTSSSNTPPSDEMSDEALLIDILDCPNLKTVILPTHMLSNKTCEALLEDLKKVKTIIYSN